MKRTATPAAADPSLAAARARIAPAYDAGLFRDAGHALADALADHLGGVMGGAGPVLNWNAPDENVAAATAALRGEPVAGGDGVVERVRGLVGEALSPRAEPALAAVYRPPGPGERADRGAVRRRRVRHEPTDGDLRDGPVRQRRRGRLRERPRRETGVRGGDVRGVRHARREPRQHHLPAHRPQRIVGRFVGVRRAPLRPGPGDRGPRGEPLLHRPQRRHPRAGNAERGEGRPQRPPADRPGSNWTRRCGF